mmetsp:Transcript_14421/g.20140  ORF Transcript_14421/g.20140 Transcript_14421/m.20140 type:complete len:698 (+) Transcript_14421:237-2330(+)
MCACCVFLMHDYLCIPVAIGSKRGRSSSHLTDEEYDDRVRKFLNQEVKTFNDVFGAKGAGGQIESQVVGADAKVPDSEQEDSQLQDEELELWGTKEGLIVFILPDYDLFTRTVIDENDRLLIITREAQSLAKRILCEYKDYHMSIGSALSQRWKEIVKKWKTTAETLSLKYNKGWKRTVTKAQLLVTGNPGIGKSRYLHYLLYLFVKVHSIDVGILSGGGKCAVVYADERNICRKSVTERDLGTVSVLLCEPGGDPTHPTTVTGFEGCNFKVMVHCPDQDRIKEYAKRANTFIYSPLTFGEVEGYLMLRVRRRKKKGEEVWKGFEAEPVNMDNFEETEELAHVLKVSHHRFQWVGGALRYLIDAAAFDSRIAKAQEEIKSVPDAFIDDASINKISRSLIDVKSEHPSFLDGDSKVYYRPKPLTLLKEQRQARFLKELYRDAVEALRREKGDKGHAFERLVNFLFNSLTGVTFQRLEYKFSEFPNKPSATTARLKFPSSDDDAKDPGWWPFGKTLDANFVKVNFPLIDFAYVKKEKLVVLDVTTEQSLPEFKLLDSGANTTAKYKLTLKKFSKMIRELKLSSPDVEMEYVYLVPLNLLRTTKWHKENRDKKLDKEHIVKGDLSNEEISNLKNHELRQALKHRWLPYSKKSKAQLQAELKEHLKDHHLVTKLWDNCNVSVAGIPMNLDWNSFRKKVWPP